MTKLFYQTIFLCSCFCIISCYTNKTLFSEKDGNGTTIHASSQKNSTFVENRYFLAGRSNTKEKIHEEYFVNRFNCDTIIKKVFKGNNAQIYLFSSEKNPPYQISEPDKKILNKLIPFIEPTNKSYQECIGNLTGLKIYYDGKIKRSLF